MIKSNIHDVHQVLEGQYRKRIAFYKQCAYRVLVKEPGGAYEEKGKGKKSAGADQLPDRPMFSS